ncbi:MAG: hypothetical protein JW902_11150 [Syntrophaceae bacterium]|nr:hypothetical protein [Syntrophaceae bacterium]
MKPIDVHDLKEGMVLAKDIHGKNNALLMGKGVTINSDSLEQLIRLGVSVLWIETPDEKSELSDKQKEAIKEEVEAMLDSQFERVSENPIMQELKELFANHLIRKKTA